MSPSIWTALAAVALATLSLHLRLTRQPLRRTIPSPRDTLLPKLSSKQATALPYPPDLLPGARDVATPYGVMRVYEWGPENGDKVVFIHGDTTPAPMLGPIARHLVERGCRVMMFGMSSGSAALPIRLARRPLSLSLVGYIILTATGVKDLWGRGYSDTPLDVPHDGRLFKMQIFFAAASSPLSWTGAESGSFSIVAFSLGGGIAMGFAADFPYLIKSIVLLAPGGIIRRLPDDYETLFRYAALLPSSYLKNLVGKAIGLKVSHTPSGSIELHDRSQKGPEMAQEALVMGKEVLDVPRIVQWQFENHKGFIHSFISTLQNGPIQHQHSDWKRVGNVIKGDTVQPWPSSHSSRLINSKLLVIFGETDSVVRAEEVSADLLELFGDPEYVQFKVVAGDHGFPVPNCDEVAKHIADFFGLESGE